MSYWTGALIALLFLVFALASRKLSGSILTGPMLFADFGIAIGFPAESLNVRGYPDPSRKCS